MRLPLLLLAGVLGTACQRQPPAPLPTPLPPDVQAPVLPAEPTPTAVPEPATPVAAPVAPTPVDAAALAGRWVEAWNTDRTDEALALFTDDVEQTFPASPALPRVDGKSALQQHWTAWRTAFPDGRWHLRRVLHGAGDTVVLQLAWLGTHRGPLLGLKASDKPAGAEVLQIWSLQDGKIHRVQAYFSSAALLAQIGALPDAVPPPVPPPSAITDVVQGDDSQTQTAVARAFYAAVQAPDLAGWLDVVAADAVFLDAAEGRSIQGVEAGRKSLAAWKRVFPDPIIEVEQVTAFGPWVLVRATTTATHGGDLGPIRATGKKVVLHTADLLRIDAGRVVETVGYADPAELLSQIGAFPLPSPQTPTAK